MSLYPQPHILCQVSEAGRIVGDLSPIAIQQARQRIDAECWPVEDRCLVISGNTEAIRTQLAFLLGSGPSYWRPGHIVASNELPAMVQNALEFDGHCIVQDFPICTEIDEDARGPARCEIRIYTKPFTMYPTYMHASDIEPKTPIPSQSEGWLPNVSESVYGTDSSSASGRSAWSNRADQPDRAAPDRF